MEKPNKKGTVLPYSSRSSSNTSIPTRVVSPNSEYQELADFSSTGRKRPWIQKKTNSTLVGDAFSRLSLTFPDSMDYFTKKADKIYNCGNYLVFQKFADNSMRLKEAYFCRQRLCTMCNWRRSLKIFSQVSKIMDSMKNETEYEYLFLTLTIRNVDGPELKKAISDMIQGFLKLIRRNRVCKCVHGTFRALEVTYNKESETFHPHLHIVLAVNKAYLAGKYYIKQNEWADMWRDCMNLDYVPIVHIEKTKGDNKKAVAECAKYATKEEDLFDMDENNEKKAIDEVIFTLDEALKGRRLISFSGVFKDYQKKLKLQDPEDGDLIHIDDDAIRPDLQYVLETYNWRCGTYLSRKCDSETA
jgi:plasmid rolling circle replication initiator protein Rep